MKRWRWWLLFILLMFVVQLVLTWPSDRLYIVQCDVGQGDASLITRNTTQVLIDGGPPNNKVLLCLADNMPMWDRRIELVVATHPDADHIGGLVEVFKRYKVDTLLVPDYVHDTDLFWSFYELSKDKSKVVTVKQGSIIQIEGMEWKVLWPEKSYNEPLVWDYNFDRDDNFVRNEQIVPFIKRQPRDGNSISIVMNLEYGSFRALFTGDVGVNEENVLKSSGLLSTVHILKVGHHGSKTSTSVDFLEKVSPRYGLIGVGAGNKYGHPNKEVVDRLTDYGVEILRTDVLGTIKLWTDGTIMSN